MTRRERLMTTLRGEPVDRPAVSFYEIDGSQDMENQDPFNIYNHPSWKPLIELARRRSDRIVRRGVSFKNEPRDPLAESAKTETCFDGVGSILTTTTIRAGKRVLTTRTKRDKDIDTVWTIEHLLKDPDDLKAYLELPEPVSVGEPDTSVILNIEKNLGDGGIAMIDTADPLCCAAPLFEMGQFTVVAMTEPGLFHRLLERFSRWILPRTEAIAGTLPGNTLLPLICHRSCFMNMLLSMTSRW
jgi:hypothetical protein